MNLYLISLLIYSLMILPIKVSFRVRLGRRPGYWVRFQAMGLPFLRRRKDDDTMEEHPINEAEVSAGLNRDSLLIFRALLSPHVRRRLRRLCDIRLLTLYAHISCQDASHTALLYGSLRTAVQLVERLNHRPLPAQIHLRADYQALGSEVLLRGIVSLRLGSLIPATAVWLSQLRRMRAIQEPSKEENYAASH
ncbi:MAG: hypothetical protein E7319_04085 [Clostridiales bacterium]|nr:hypothetical protein [Clostridiales bacterium]